MGLCTTALFSTSCVINRNTVDKLRMLLGFDFNEIIYDFILGRGIAVNFLISVKKYVVESFIQGDDF
jgi:hypothetical protein